jgi:hypothetical protein
MAGKVYASFREFFDGVRSYHHISEQAYINARDLKRGSGQEKESESPGQEPPADIERR